MIIVISSSSTIHVVVVVVVVVVAAVVVVVLLMDVFTCLYAMDYFIVINMIHSYNKYCYHAPEAAPLRRLGVELQQRPTCAIVTVMTMTRITIIVVMMRLSSFIVSLS